VDLPEGPTALAIVLPGHRPHHLRGVHVPPSARLELSPIELVLDLQLAAGRIQAAARTTDGADVALTAEVRDLVAPTPPRSLAPTRLGPGAASVSVDLAPGLYALALGAPGYLGVELPVLVEPGVTHVLDDVMLTAGLAQDEALDVSLGAELGDRDGDGLDDAEERVPGRDGAVTDPTNADTDADGAPDGADTCPDTPDDQHDGDGDGVGDACDREPVLRRVAPTVGRAGDWVELRGPRVGAETPAVVVFGAAVALSEPGGGSDVVRVRVPTGATSGPLRLVASHGTTTSTATFTVLDSGPSGPRIYGVSRSWAVVGGAVTLEGAGFVGAQPVVVSVGGVPARILDLSVVDSAATPPRERLELVVDRVASGPVRVETTQGLALSVATLGVVAAPRVRALDPAAVRVGEYLRIDGEGFDTRVTGGAVEVVFSGDRRAPAERLTDDSLEVRVPAGARDGPVEVRHPAGSSLSAVDLRVLPAPARVDAVAPRAAAPGQSIVVSGHGLDQARVVRFAGVGGAVEALRWSATSSAVSVVVPPTARAGTVELVLADGSSVRTPPVVLLREVSLWREPAMVDGRGLGFGFDGTGGRLYVVSAVVDQVRVRELDAATWATVQDRSLAAPVPGTRFVSFQVAPSGAWGVLAGDTPTGPRSWVVDLPGFVLRGSCLDRPAFGAKTATFRFDGLSSRAYAVGALGSAPGEDAVLRLNQASGACERIATVPGAGTLAALISERAAPFALWVAHRTLGLRRWEPGAADYVGAWDGIAAASTQLFWAPDGTTLWAAGGPTLQRRVVGALPVELLAPSGPGAAAAQTSDGRWLLYTGRTTVGADAGLLIDLTRGEVSGAPATDLQSEFGLVAHPTRPVYVGAVARGGLARFELEE
jgi:hypothetical protein